MKMRTRKMKKAEKQANLEQIKNETTFKTWIQITKLPLVLLVATSAYFGYLINGPLFSFEALLLFLGIGCLAAGGAVLNNIQDRKLDQTLKRTQNRALITQEFPLPWAILLVLFLIPLALFLLYTIHQNLSLVIMGIMAVIFYNGIYTTSKRWSVLSIIPGAICGMLPPYMGYFAWSQSLWGIDVLAITFILFFWQLPHFWLITSFYPHDYQNTQLSLPSMLKLFGQKGLNRLIFIWSCSYAVITLSVPFFNIVSHPIIKSLFVFNAWAIVIFLFYRLFLKESQIKGYKQSFMALNLSFVNVMALVIVQKAIL
jgi:protoheme IX farnesyltransferase